MIDISSTLIQKLIVHRIGNKLRDEGITLSKKESDCAPLLSDLILKSYLAPIIRQGNVYDFHHESDLSLNTVRHFSRMIFENKESFTSCSQSIAKHLYSASTHPNIGGGEFIVIHFEDIRTENGREDALGFFRIEGKNDYLDVSLENGSFHVFGKTGISLERIQKGAIALSKTEKVYVVDSLGQKTKYWIESFLKVVPGATSKLHAKAVGSFLKAVHNKVTSPSDALEFGHRLQSLMENSDNVAFNDIRSISTDYLIKDEVDSILAGIQGGARIDIASEPYIDKKQLSKYTQDVVTKTRITDGIHLLVSNSHVSVSSLNISKTPTGIKAIIDIHIVGE